MTGESHDEIVGFRNAVTRAKKNDDGKVWATSRGEAVRGQHDDERAALGALGEEGETAWKRARDAFMRRMRNPTPRDVHNEPDRGFASEDVERAYRAELRRPCC